jgi:hypothetical protein
LDADVLEPLERVQLGDIPAREEGTAKPQLRRFTHPQLSLIDGAYLPTQSHLSHHDRVLIQRPFPQTRGHCSHDPEINRWLVDLHPSHDVHIDVLARKMEPEPLFHDGQQERHTIDLHSVRHPLRHGIRGGGYQGLQFDQDRAGSLHTRDDHGPGAANRPFGQEQFGRIADLGQPGVFHLENTELIRRSESIFHRSKHAMPVALFPLEIQDGIDDVFQEARPRDRTVLGHVTNDKNRDAASLGEPHQLRRHFLNLADASGRGGQLIGVNGLN